jgi:hypothetical protein
MEAIRSGSRWSSFYCGECRKMIVERNRSAHGWAIPLGRHSLLNGISLGLVEDRQRFSDEVGGLFDAIDRLEEWSRGRVKSNVRSLVAVGLLDLDAGEAIDLAPYISASRTGGPSKKEAFRELTLDFDAVG